MVKQKSCVVGDFRRVDGFSRFRPNFRGVFERPKRLLPFVTNDRNISTVDNITVLNRTLNVVKRRFSVTKRDDV